MPCLDDMFNFPRDDSGFMSRCAPNRLPNHRHNPHVGYFSHSDITIQNDTGNTGIPLAAKATRNRNGLFVIPTNMFLNNKNAAVGTFRHSPSAAKRMTMGLKEMLWEDPKQPFISQLQVTRELKQKKSIISEALKNLPFSRFECTDGSDAPSCIICLTCYEDGDEIRTLGCSHCYHKHCIDVWLEGFRLACPVCCASVSFETSVMVEREGESNSDSDSDSDSSSESGLDAGIISDAIIDEQTQVNDESVSVLGECEAQVSNPSHESDNKAVDPVVQCPAASDDSGDDSPTETSLSRMLDALLPVIASDDLETVAGLESMTAEPEDHATGGSGGHAQEEVAEDDRSQCDSSLHSDSSWDLVQMAEVSLLRHAQGGRAGIRAVPGVVSVVTVPTTPQRLTIGHHNMLNAQRLAQQRRANGGVGEGEGAVFDASSDVASEDGDLLSNH